VQSRLRGRQPQTCQEERAKKEAERAELEKWIALAVQDERNKQKTEEAKARDDKTN